MHRRTSPTRRSGCSRRRTSARSSCPAARTSPASSSTRGRTGRGSAARRAWPTCSSATTASWAARSPRTCPSEERAGLADHVGAKPGDCIFFAAGPVKASRALLGAARLEIGRRGGLIDARRLVVRLGGGRAAVRVGGRPRRGGRFGRLDRRTPCLHHAHG